MSEDWKKYEGQLKVRWLGHVQKTDGGDTRQTILNLELSVKRKPTVGHADGWSNRK